jgi:sialate O-acetylesterase
MNRAPGIFYGDGTLKTSIPVFFLALLATAAQAEVRLAHIFSEHMVLQRQQPIAVWGWADPGEAVRVEFHGKHARTRANAQGEWRVKLPAQRAGGPYSLVVQGQSRIALNDVLVGDLWLASGQSNMEWSVAQSDNAAAELVLADWPQIRHIKIPKAVAFAPQQDFAATEWKVANPANTGEFSAAGYFFARKVHQETGVPIGIINASWGGTHIETWTSKTALATQPDFDMRAMPPNGAALNAAYKARMTALVGRWQRGLALADAAPARWQGNALDDSAWPQLNAPQIWEEQGLADFDGVVWYRREIELTAPQATGAATLHLGMVDDCDETFVNGVAVGHNCQWDAQRHYGLPAGLLNPGKNVIAVRVTDNGGGGGFHGEAKAMQLQTSAESLPLAGAWRARVEGFKDKGQPDPNDLPTLLFNAMIQPLTPLPIKGVIWYQGESNVPRAQQYTQTFPLLIKDWRAQWRQPNLPFYFVQLASFLPLDKNSLQGSAWAELRDAQRQTLKLPGTGMAVATDIGNANDIHPRNKQAAGQRLALLALKNDYGKAKLIAGGPDYRSMRVRAGQIELSFADVGAGLMAGKPGEALRGFMISDESRRFVPAQARIKGNKVIASHPDMAQPVAVRFGWVDNPEQDNLFNREGLPASPFRTDDWPWLTDGVKYRFD